MTTPSAGPPSQRPLDKRAFSRQQSGIDAHPKSNDGAPAVTVPPELDRARLDKAVKQAFDLPWIKARAWIDTGKVFVNGVLAAERDRAVAAGDRLELRMSAPKRSAAPELDPRAVVFFDEHLIIVNKPAGIMSVPHRESEETATLDRLAQAYLRAHDSNTSRTRASLGVVHRIDKETSGLIVFARDFATLQGLSKQFREHTIERRYLAIAHGEATSRTIRSRLARDTGAGIRGSVADGRANKAGEQLGRIAITHVEAVEKLRGATLVACRLETGRTHQIRIHLSEAGHPIVGEKVYIRAYKGPIIPADRVMLHAAELGFVHPISGERVSWQQPLPEDFAARLATLRA